jgi:hypothetical protein
MLKCPKDKLINPSTGNCVKRDGRIGKLLLSQKKSKKTKCPAGKVINPITGNCVKRDGRVGKALLSSKKSSLKKIVKKSTKKSSFKKCPVGKIINPITGNCIKSDGKVGKSLLSAKKSSKKSVRNSSKKSSKKKPAAKSCIRQTTAKYHKTTRKSPPYPANQCHGKSLYGNDGNMYVSVSNVNGIYTWRLKK